MRKIFYFLIFCIFVGFALFVFMSINSPLPTLAKTFFINLEQGSYPQGYALCSPGFKEKYSLSAFTSNIQAAKLDQYKQANWITNETSEDKKRGMLTGEMTRQDDTRVSLEIDFVGVDSANWAERGWRVDDIRVLPPASPRAP